MNASEHDNNKLRIDKWLWAARFFKTRALAVNAIETGKVLCNELRVKPAKGVAVGDQLTLRLGKFQFDIEVRALSDKRGPAPQVQKLYQESAASQQKRAALAAEAKAQPEQTILKGRPTKRDRRDIERFKTGAW